MFLEILKMGFGQPQRGCYYEVVCLPRLYFQDTVKIGITIFHRHQDVVDMWS